MKKVAVSSLLSLSAGLCAAVFYVSPAGNDKNPGTSPEKPFKTIGYAASKAESGDTVMIKGGIYREQISREWRFVNPKPITFKAFPDETPVVTFGWPIKNWKKSGDGLFVSAASFPYAVIDFWQKLTLDRYLRVYSMDLLKKQPGAFYQDTDNGKIYVNPLEGSWHDDPEKAGFIAIPASSREGKILPFNTKEVMKPRAGTAFVGKNVIVDGLSFEFHSAVGLSIRGRKFDYFYGSAQIRNCAAIGTTLGISANWVVENTVIENCRAIRNSGAGIQVGNYIKNIVVRNNFLLNNGGSMPFYGNFSTTNGVIYNLARYGGPEADNVDFIGNKVIWLDGARKGGVMRCKGGIRTNTNQTNNLFIGGSVDIVSAPGSAAAIKNNTLVRGRYKFTIPRSGQKYTPDIKDNIELPNDNPKNAARFVNPAKYDYRLLPDSKFLGQGIAPEAAPVWFVKPGAKKNGTGRTPESPLSNLAELQSKLKSGDTVYFLPGTYTGKLAVKNLKDVVLSDMTFNKARFKNATFTFENARNIRIENMDFNTASFNLAGSSVEFKESFFTNSTFNAAGGKAVFANSHLEKSKIASTGRVVVRENLIDKVQLNAKDIVSENNGFVDGAELKAWPAKETFKSFVASENGKVPLKNLLFGARGNWVGRRVVKDTIPKLKLEYFNVTPLDCGTKAVLAWNTPKDYVRASINVYEGDKQVFHLWMPFGEYLTTAKEILIPGLEKGKTYKLTASLTRYNGAGLNKTVTFTMPAKEIVNTPKELTVGAGTKYPTIGAALKAARKGDTIFIKPGTYTEMLQVYPDNITIKAKPGTVKWSAAYMFDYCLKATYVKNLTIDGIDFTGLRYSAYTKGLLVMNSEKTKVLNCRFFPNKTGGASNAQICAQYVNGFEIRNCVFNSGFQAAWLIESDNVIIDHNTFWGVGINAIHVGGGPKAKVVITNNLMQDVVANHKSPAVSIGHKETNFVCDWNLYWKTDKRCPGQKIFGQAGILGIDVWHVLTKDTAVTIDEARKRFKIEKNGLFADPKLKNPEKGDFTLLPGSPAIKRGSDGKDIGADLTVFAGK